jgi:predicted transposase YbfD/YdcC
MAKRDFSVVGFLFSDSLLVLAKEATDEKSNEITAILKLLANLELKGCIVTIEAISYQKSIASKIVDQEADYVLRLKGNQGI